MSCCCSLWSVALWTLGSWFSEDWRSFSIVYYLNSAALEYKTSFTRWFKWRFLCSKFISSACIDAIWHSRSSSFVRNSDVSCCDIASYSFLALIVLIFSSFWYFNSSCALLRLVISQVLDYWSCESWNLSLSASASEFTLRCVSSSSEILTC